MELIDTHTHLYLPQFDEDRTAMLQRAQDSGVKKLFLPNIDLQSIAGMMRLVEDYPGICYPMMGLHPCDVKEDFQEVLAVMREKFSDERFIAVGEIGIDLYWDKTTLPQQVEAFRQQIQWAKDLSLPIVIHARESFDEIFAVLDDVNERSLTGVFHCFTGNAEQAQKIMDYGGFFMGIGGVLTYEKSGLDKVVADIPLDYLVLETDSPFLSPKPFRGKRNESAYVGHIARKLAEIKNTTLEEIAAATSSNAYQLFHRVKKEA